MLVVWLFFWLQCEWLCTVGVARVFEQTVWGSVGLARWGGEGVGFVFLIRVGSWVGSCAGGRREGDVKGVLLHRLGYKTTSWVLFCFFFFFGVGRVGVGWDLGLDGAGVFWIWCWCWRFFFVFVFKLEWFGVGSGARSPLFLWAWSWGFLFGLEGDVGGYDGFGVWESKGGRESCGDESRGRGRCR